MGFFGIGAPEMVIILVVALIIFGPGKLPEVAGQAGKAVRDFRRMTSELSGEFEKTVNEAGAGDLKASLTGELTGMKSQVDNVSKSVQRDLNKAATTVSSTASTAAGAKPKPAKPATPKTAKPAAAKSATNGTGASAAAPTVATKADPLADVSFMDEPVAEAKAGDGAGKSDVASAISNGGASGTGDSIPQQSASPEQSAPSSGTLPSDALARARQRRQTAGYGSHRRS
ncbi:MAG: twin-arginine translocase TatA/TatE family subunit [Chloroflexota bacterium]|nr:twin-arginine translocase TatA/TatE family subunit [Chloroflexota bacterium]